MDFIKILFTPSIRRRNTLSLASIALLTVGLAAAILFQLSQIRPYSESIAHDVALQKYARAITVQLFALDGDLERYILLQSPEYRELAQSEIQGLAEAVGSLRSDTDAELEPILAEMESLLPRLQGNIDRLLNKTDSLSTGEVNKLILETYADLESFSTQQQNLSQLLVERIRQTAQTQSQIANRVQAQTLAVSILVGVIAIAVAIATDLSLRNITRLTAAAAGMAQGDLTQRAEFRSRDELGVLANAFNDMATQLQSLITTLEERVAARTKDLATVAEVGTATATILETDRLLQEVVDLTKERFNLYHSHIYLLDEAGENLVLASGAGEAGRQMKAKGHSIPASREQSLVARAARERKGVTVNDVTQAADFLPNPLLPETRSELAVPMIVGGKVIGVFDIQSEQVGRFGESDVNIQTTLAAQVATSIQNVRSFEQSKAQADLESLVNAIGQKIQRTTTVDDTLQTAIRELGLALGASRVSASIGVQPVKQEQQ